MKREGSAALWDGAPPSEIIICAKCDHGKRDHYDQGRCTHSHIHGDARYFCTCLKFRPFYPCECGHSEDDHSIPDGPLPEGMNPDGIYDTCNKCACVSFELDMESWADMELD